MASLQVWPTCGCDQLKGVANFAGFTVLALEKDSFKQFASPSWSPFVLLATLILGLARTAGMHIRRGCFPPLFIPQVSGSESPTVVTYMGWRWVGSQENRMLITIWGKSKLAFHLLRNLPHEMSWIWVEKRRKMSGNGRRLGFGMFHFITFSALTPAATAVSTLSPLWKHKDVRNNPERRLPRRQPAARCCLCCWLGVDIKGIFRRPLLVAELCSSSRIYLNCGLFSRHSLH
jgi:hypothetical protein